MTVKRISQCKNAQNLLGTTVIVVPPHIRNGAFSKAVSKQFDTPELALKNVSIYHGDILVKKVTSSVKDEQGHYSEVIKWQCFEKRRHKDYEFLPTGRRVKKTYDGTGKIYYQPEVKVN